MHPVDKTVKWKASKASLLIKSLMPERHRLDTCYLLLKLQMLGGHLLRELRHERVYFTHGFEK